MINMMGCERSIRNPQLMPLSSILHLFQMLNPEPQKSVVLPQQVHGKDIQPGCPAVPCCPGRRVQVAPASPGHCHLICHLLCGAFPSRSCWLLIVALAWAVLCVLNVGRCAVQAPWRVWRNIIYHHTSLYLLSLWVLGHWHLFIVDT